MAWRPAYSLQTLKSQLDAAYPGWTFLGFLGDQAHASVPSDHNPNSAGVVTALDIGPGGGLAIHDLAENLREKPHPDLKYIISNRRIAEWQNGFAWRPYGGSDPHDTHIHVSVGRGPDGQSTQPYDDRNNWNIKGGDEVIPNTNYLNALFVAFRNQNANQEEVDKYVGKVSYNDLIPSLNSGPVRAAVYEAVQIGFVAKRDKWQQQIVDLQSEVKKLSAGQKLTEDEKKALDSKIDDFKKSLDTAYNN